MIRNLILLAMMGFSGCFGQAPQAAPQAQRTRIDQTVHILLEDDRLYPNSLKLVEGQYRFLMHNSFVISKLDLRLDDDRGNKQREGKIERNATKGEVFTLLTPGKYILYVAQRPQWRCEIQVTAKGR